MEHMRDTDTTVMPPFTEAEFGAWLRMRGMKITEHRGRFWKEKPFGFFQPLHYLAYFRPGEATRPAPWCWGFRAALESSSIGRANGFTPIHRVPELSGYCLEVLGSRRRTKIRSARKKMRIVELLSPDLLLEQGRDIVESFRKRRDLEGVPSEQGYRRKVENLFAGGPYKVIAGMEGERLGGYITAKAVGNAVYFEDVMVHTDYLKTNLASALTFELIQIARRSEGIEEVVHGQHAREQEELCWFKQDMGFEVAQIPSRTWFAPLMGHIIRRRDPHVYYRLCGRF